MTEKERLDGLFDFERRIRLLPFMEGNGAQKGAFDAVGVFADFLKTYHPELQIGAVGFNEVMRWSDKLCTRLLAPCGFYTLYRPYLEEEGKQPLSWDDSVTELAKRTADSILEALEGCDLSKVHVLLSRFVIGTFDDDAIMTLLVAVLCREVQDGHEIYHLSEKEWKPCTRPSRHTEELSPEPGLEDSSLNRKPSTKSERWLDRFKRSRFVQTILHRR